MSAPDVLGIGANSLDLVYLLPEYPQPDSASAKLRISAHHVSPGGQTATAMATCAALGVRTAYVGVFGSDAHGHLLRDTLTGRGVDVSRAVTRAAPNRYAVILIDERHGERVILWDRDDRLALRADELPLDLLASARVVHVDDEDEAAALTAAQLARAAGALVTSDIDRVTARTRDLIAAVSVPIFAEHAPAALTGLTDPEAAARALFQPHHRLLCVTLGARGAAAFDGERWHTAPAFPVAVTDTTGAGDVWRGACIAALLRGQPVADLLRFANAAAAVACTRRGAIGGVPALSEVTAISGSAAAASAFEEDEGERRDGDGQ